MQPTNRVECDEIFVPVFATARSRTRLTAANFAAESLRAQMREFATDESQADLLSEINSRIRSRGSLPYPFFWDASLSLADAPDQPVVCRWSVLPNLDRENPDRDEWTITVVPWAGEGLSRVTHRISSTVGTRFFWAEYARSYDPVLNEMPFYQTAVHRHVSAIADVGAQRVLDVGCGTGNVALPLALQGRSVTLIDNCIEMLETAHDKLRKENLHPPSEFHLLSATDMKPFETSSFDAVNVLLVLFNIAEGRQALESIVNCVRPGGLLVFTEPLRSFDEEPLLELGQEIVRQSAIPRIDYHWRVVSQAGQRLGQLIRDVPDQNSQPGTALIRADELPESLSELGCDVVTNIDSHLGQCRHIVAIKRLDL